MRLALSLVDTCVCRLPFHYNSFFYTLKRRFATTSFLSESCNNFLYTKRHDWILVREGVGTVGVNRTALESLDNIVGVKTPKLGQKLRRDDTVGKILYDSNSLALTICAPVSGTVVERNNALQSSISLVNQLIGKEGWLYKIQIENKAELKELLNEKAYNKFCCVNIVFTIPNALCIARIAATPFIGYLVVIELFMPACTLFAIAGLTDLLDGWIARRYPSQRSVLGSALDPIADKFLISTLFVTLSYSNLIPVLLTSVVLLRDVLLVVGGFVRRYQLLELPFTIRRFFDPSISSIHITPTLTSKINTVLQLSLVTLSLGSPVFGYENHAFLTALCMCTGATTVFSGLQYASGKAIRPVKK